MSDSVPMLSLRRPTPSLLATALALALASPAAFAETASDAQTKDLEAVVVTASPLKGNAESVATPVDVLYGEDLDKAKAGTLGETVAKLPGVQTTYFGTGVGRPILRGQDGPRVQVLWALPTWGIGATSASRPAPTAPITAFRPVPTCMAKKTMTMKAKRTTNTRKKRAPSASTWCRTVWT